MNKKRVILHIGMPKCASTSIQNALAKSEDVDYVGFLPEMNNRKFYSNDDMAELFDKELRFSCKRTEYFRKIINNYIDNSKQPIIVFSSENITLRWLPWDVPTHIKLEFIKNIFPESTEFIFVYRNPFDIFVSLYKETVLIGNDKTFNSHIEELYMYKDISYFNDVMLNEFLELFDEVFGLDKLSIIFSDTDNIVKQFSSLININLNDSLEKSNVSITKQEIDLLVEYNAKVNDFKHLYDNIELHRAFPNIVNEGVKYSLAKKRKIRKTIIKELMRYNIKVMGCMLIENESIVNAIISDLSKAICTLKRTNITTLHLEKYMNLLNQNGNKV